MSDPGLHPELSRSARAKVWLLKRGLFAPLNWLIRLAVGLRQALPAVLSDDELEDAGFAAKHTPEGRAENKRLLYVVAAKAAASGSRRDDV